MAQKFANLTASGFSDPATPLTTDIHCYFSFFGKAGFVKVKITVRVPGKIPIKIHDNLLILKSFVEEANQGWYDG